MLVAETHQSDVKFLGSNHTYTIVKNLQRPISWLELLGSRTLECYRSRDNDLGLSLVLSGTVHCLLLGKTLQNVSA